MQADGGKVGTLVTKTDWIGPDGKTICSDVRTLRFGGDANKRWIDFDVIVTAVADEVKFGDTKEGSFGLRIAESMRVDRKLGGKIVTSEGPRGRQGLGKAGEVGRLLRPGAGRAARHRDPQSSVELPLSDALARADVWPVCREPVGPGRFFEGQGERRAHDEEGRLVHAGLPRDLPQGDREGWEDRGGVCGVLRRSSTVRLGMTHTAVNQRFHADAQIFTDIGMRVEINDRALRSYLYWMIAGGARIKAGRSAHNPVPFISFACSFKTGWHVSISIAGSPEANSCPALGRRVHRC